MQCRCTKPHARLEGTYQGVARTHLARVWPWKLASTIANGVAALTRRHHKATRRARSLRKPDWRLYPIKEEPKEEQETQIRTYPPYEQKSRSRPYDWACKACQLTHPATSGSHTRDTYECKWPLVEPIIWGCEACIKNRPSTP